VLLLLLLVAAPLPPRPSPALLRHPWRLPPATRAPVRAVVQRKTVVLLVFMGVSTG
jgi:hypothetical protein